MNKLQAHIKSAQSFLKEIFDDNIPADVLNQSLAIEKQKAYFQEHALSTLMPYEAYDEATGIYHNRESLGFVISGIPMLSLDEESLASITSFLQDKLPDGAVLQVLLFASPDIENALNQMQANRGKRGGIFAELAKKRADFLREGVRKSLLKSEDYLIRDFKLYFSVTMPRQTNMDDVIKLKDSLLLALKSINMAHELLKPSGLIRLTQQLINPWIDLNSIPEYEDSEHLGVQAAPTDTSLSLDAQTISLNEGAIQAKSYRLTQYPQQWLASTMSDLIGDSQKTSLRIGNPFLLSVLIYAGEHESDKLRLQTMNLRSTQKASSKLANMIPNLVSIDQDLKYTVKAVDDGDKLLKTCFNLTVYGTQITLDKGATQVESLLTAKKFKFARLKYMQLPAFLSSLPMKMHQTSYRELKAFGWFKTKLASSVSHFMPLLAENKGMPVPLLPILGSKGQFGLYNALANSQGGNYNAVTVGVSGSGKSNFNQEKVLSRIGAGGRAFIIDAGGSYEKNAMLLSETGAQYIEFTPKSNISLNPFSNINVNEMNTDPSETMALLKPMIAQMISPNAGLNDLQLSYVENAIMDTWHKHQRQSTITHVGRYLKNHEDTPARNLGQMLSPYMNGGSFAHYFSGDCNINFDSPLVCFELDGLKNKKDLQSVVLMMLIYQITQAMYLGDRKTQITCLIDEAWDIIKQVQGSSFLNDACRRARKYNGSMNICSQNITDVFENLLIASAQESIDFIEVLRQKPASVKKAVAKGQLDVTAQQADILAKLTAKSGEYAEIAIIGPGLFLYGKLIWDSFSAELYSSTPDDLVKFKKHMKDGLSITQALTKMMETKHERKVN